MALKVIGLDSAPFERLYGLSDSELAKFRAIRYVVDESPGFPERIEMRDGEIGEHFLLVNFMHQKTSSPYRSTHAVFVREGATNTYVGINEIPEVLLRRQLSVRSFDNKGMMLEASLVDGKHCRETMENLLSNTKNEYLHVHYAAQGCYAARVEKAG